jgi:hypothetical protein
VEDNSHVGSRAATVRCRNRITSARTCRGLLVGQRDLPRGTPRFEGAPMAGTERDSRPPRPLLTDGRSGVAGLARPDRSRRSENANQGPAWTVGSVHS